MLTALQQWVPHHHEDAVLHEHAVGEEMAHRHHHHGTARSAHSKHHHAHQHNGNRIVFVSREEVADCYAHCHIHVHTGTSDCGIGVVVKAALKKWKQSLHPALPTIEFQPGYPAVVASELISSRDAFLPGLSLPGDKWKRGPPCA